VRIFAVFMSIISVAYSSDAFAWPEEWKACKNTSECVLVFALCGEGWIAVNSAYEKNVVMQLARSGRTFDCSHNEAEKSEGATSQCTHNQCEVVPHSVKVR
jgi:hypothetical protein